MYNYIMMFVNCIKIQIMFFRDIDFFFRIQIDVLKLELSMFRFCFDFCCLKGMFYNFNMHLIE